MVGNTSYNIYKVLFNNTKIIFNSKNCFDVNFADKSFFFFFQITKKKKNFKIK